MSLISRFFINCSGANKKILAELPPNYLGTEKTKLIGIGGAIFFTAFLAFISFSFALSTFVKDVDLGSININDKSIPIVINKFVICIGLGIVWGTMIFNLDRYIVSSMRKRGNKRLELLNATPRILIALLFAVVISKPLELEIFRTEIEAQLPETAEQQTLQFQGKIDSIILENQTLQDEIDSLFNDPYSQKRIGRYESGLENSKAEVDSIAALSANEKVKLIENLNTLFESYNDADRRKSEWEDEKTNIEQLLEQDSLESSQILTYKSLIEQYDKNIETVTKEKNKYSRQVKKINNRLGIIDGNILDSRKKKENAETELAAESKLQEERADREIAEKKGKIKANQTKIESSEAKIKDIQEKFSGLLARLKALEDLKKYPVIRVASTLVFLLFLSIETAPIFVKLISNPTLYDQILEEYEKPIPNKEAIHQRIEKHFEFDMDKIEEEKSLLKDFHQKKLQIQKEYLDKSLEHLRNMEAIKFENDKDNFTQVVANAPENYVSALKSDPSPMVSKDNELFWDDEGLVDSNKLILNRAIIIGVVILGISSMYYFFIYDTPINAKSPSSEIENAAQTPNITLIQQDDVTPKDSMKEIGTDYLEGTLAINEEENIDQDIKINNLPATLKKDKNPISKPPNKSRKESKKDNVTQVKNDNPKPLKKAEPVPLVKKDTTIENNPVKLVKDEETTSSNVIQDTLGKNTPKDTIVAKEVKINEVLTPQKELNDSLVLQKKATADTLKTGPSEVPTPSPIDTLKQKN